jgi:hypothetical protein
VHSISFDPAPDGQRRTQQGFARVITILVAGVALAQMATSVPAGNNGAGQAAMPLTSYTAGLPSPAARYRMVKRFLGGARGAFVIPERSVLSNWSQATSLGDFVERCGPSSWIVSGVRHHSATEQGAVLLGKGGKAVQAVAIIHFDCYGEWRNLPARHAQCTAVDAPLLSVFVSHGPEASNFAKEMSGWADRLEGHHVPYKVVWVRQKAPGG